VPDSAPAFLDNGHLATEGDRLGDGRTPAAGQEGDEASPDSREVRFSAGQSHETFAATCVDVHRGLCVQELGVSRNDAATAAMLPIRVSWLSLAYPIRHF
jgi:hypothetical protein